MTDVDWFGLIVVPLLIFGARIVDVSIGTVRIVFIGRGMAVPAALAGFIESLVWILVISQILRNLTQPLYYVAYAGGFAAGNYVGLLIERRLAMGMVMVQVITQRPVGDIIARLRELGLGATVLHGEGLQGPVHIAYSVVPRRRLRAVLGGVTEVQPKAFYTVTPVAQVDQGVFPPGRLRRPGLFIRQRK